MTWLLGASLFVGGALFGCAARSFIARREREDPIESCPHFQAVSEVFNPEPPQHGQCIGAVPTGGLSVQSESACFIQNDVCAWGEGAVPVVTSHRDRPPLFLVVSNKELVN